MTEPKGTTDPTDDDTRRRATSAGAQTSEAVRQAADVLERELSSGLQEARTLQRKLVEQRGVEAGDLDEVSERLRRNAHLLIDVVSDRVADLQADDVSDLNLRFTKDAHDVFDSFVDLMSAAPGMLSDLARRLNAMAPEQSAAATPTAARATAGRAATAKKASATKATKATATKAGGAGKAPTPRARATRPTPRGATARPNRD